MSVGFAVLQNSMSLVSGGGWHSFWLPRINNCQVSQHIFTSICESHNFKYDHFFAWENIQFKVFP